MKDILLIFFIINIISCYKYILKAGRKSENYCENNNLVFSFDNCYFVNDLVPVFKNEFYLIIEENNIEYKSQCKINSLNFISSDFEILCTIENYLGCMGGSLDNYQYIKEEPNSIRLSEKDYLSFEGFTDFLNIDLSQVSDSINATITAGDLLRGDCNDNIYTFMFNNCIIRDDTVAIKKYIQNEIVFYLTLSEPKNVIATCKFNKIIKIRIINISCSIDNEDFKTCVREYGNKDLIIKSNLNSSITYKINSTNYIINFEKFENKSTIIKVSAGPFSLSESGDNKEIAFEYSINDYELKQDINFNLKYILNEKETESTKCMIDINHIEKIHCRINLEEKEKIKNLTIVENPIDSSLIPSKTINFDGFKNKSIYTIIAGQLQKGNCELEPNIYRFNFTNSIIPISKTDIIFKMKKSNLYAICTATITGNDEVIECSITKSGNSCPIEDQDDDISVSTEEPKIQTIDENITLYFSGFANKSTFTVKALYISNKYDDKEKENFYFNINYTCKGEEKEKEKIDGKSFDLTFKEEDKNIIANCIFKEGNEIVCKTLLKNIKSGKYIDMNIIKPSPIELNESISLNLEEFNNLKTYSIIAGKIELGNCISNKYKFNILNIKPSSEIPEGKYFEIKVKNTTSNNGETIPARCLLKKTGSPFFMNCEIDTCPDYIELANNETEKNETLFRYPFFYYDFNNRRTIKINGGKLIKGECYNLNNGNYKYIYTFENNTFDFISNINISFILYTSFYPDYSEQKITDCILNLSGKDNTSYCSLDLDECPNEQNDIYIMQNIASDYDSVLSPNSIFYFGFNSTNTTTIKSTKDSMIIKKEKQFIITNNIAFKDIEDFNATIKINISENIDNMYNISCSLLKPKVVSNELFNITCNISNEIYSIEKDIEILEEPIDKDKNYYFYGYKNKKTLTLKAGNLIRKNNINNKNDPFGIINNTFIGKIDDFENKIFNLNLSILDAKNEIKNSNCSFNISEITSDNKINISCSINEESFDLNIISINDNQTPILFDNNTTLNFINFEKKNLSTLSFGKITKSSCKENKNYIFYFNNTNSYKSYEEEKSINIQILINDSTYDANCLIPKQNYYNAEINIACEIIDIEGDIIDISYKPEDGYYNYIEENSLETIFIDNEELNTSTLRPGYIEKLKCENNIYEFVIKDNLISGNATFNPYGGKFELKLEQFSRNANCTIENNYKINCNLIITDDEKEIEYCQNINKDIKIKEIIGDYILINENDILYYYGYENLSTYTIQSGDIFLGKCNDNNNKYEFSINENKIFNDLDNIDEIEFNLNLSSLNEKNFICNLPNNLKKDNEFNINCSKEVDNCEEIFEKQDLIIQENPEYKEYKDYKVKNIGFKNFEGKSTIINIKETEIFLSEIDKYFSLEFNYTNNDYELNEDITFNLTINLNNTNQNIKCTLSSDKTKLINCPIGKIDLDNFNITIQENPENIFDKIEGKSIHFNEFKNKTIKLNTLFAGYMKKGYCSGDNNYHFSFVNNSNIDFELTQQFDLEMKQPLLKATCEYNQTNNEINCSIKGDEQCPVDENDEIIVGEKNPADIIIEETNDILKFANFINKTTLVYDIKVENLLKIGKKENDNCYYYFNFNKFEFDINDAKFFYENEILFKFDIYFNNQEFKSICNITKPESDKFEMECYFVLEEDYCNLDSDELMGYDINIANNVDGIKNASNCPRELNLTGFNNKKTITLNAKKILDKYIISEHFIFTIKVKETELDYLRDIIFNMNFINISSSYKELIASCNINEENNITCNDTSKSLVINNDIEIISNPSYIIINNTNYTYYFSNFTNLKTYTIRASKIQKRTKRGNNYLFRILNCKSPKIPELANISLNILINETIERTAQCSLVNETNYAMECFIPNETYIPFDITFPEDVIKTDYDLFSPNTVFYYNFEGKRAITIKAGRLYRGKCTITQDNKMIYNFNITDNVHLYNISKNISFNLILKFDEIEKESLCNMNLSGEDNTINCKLEDYCPDYFKIKSNPDYDYYLLQPNITIKYEEFINKEIYVIKMNENGKIIKTDFAEDNYNFIISNNSMLGNLANKEKYYFKININNNKTFANCFLPKIKAREFFNISCSIINDDFSFSINDEIEILEEPEDLLYYFTGYKNKRTLTLETGNIVKNIYDDRKFKIINNKFMSDIIELTEDDIEIYLDVKYSDDIINKTRCYFNMIDVDNNYVNISCSLPNEVSEIKYISILTNPESILIGKNTTLNYKNFNNLNLYSITLGNIIKNDFNNDNNILSFYFADTTISSKTDKHITLNLSVNIDKEEYISKCEIINNITKFNMTCKIQDISPIFNYDIIFEQEDYFFLNNYSTLYLDNSYISTTTLKSGYIIKESCDNTFNFSIKNNILTGNVEIDINGIFNLRLREFSSNAICEINQNENIDIKCYIILSESEKDFCSNMNKDINVLVINYIEYHYILINDNVLHLNSFESLKTHTVEAGNLIRGNCLEGNIYTFKLKDSLIYNNLENEDVINFNIKLSQPRELNSLCTLPRNIRMNNRFDIDCRTSESGDICPIHSSNDEILKIKMNPEDIIKHQLFFNNFTNKTTLILINGGVLSKEKYESDNKKYYFRIHDSTSTYSINKNINFSLTIEVDGTEKKSNCLLQYNTLNIACEINDINSEYINIKLIQNPIDDTETIPEKIIGFNNFQNKEISSVIAGKLNKGQCEQNTYKFTINNSKCQFSFDQEFYLKLKEPNKLATCKIINFDDLNKICDIQCSFEETSSCKSQYENKELIIDNKEPEFLRIDGGDVVYFYKFKQQTTIVYEIKVGNLLKSGIDKDKLKFYFKFDNGPYSLPNFKNNLLFEFNMSYNNSQVTADCELNKINNAIENSTVDLNCYFSLNEDLIQRDDLLNYDLYIGQDINKNKKVINSSQEINLIGFDNKETLTLLGKNIKNKYEEKNKINFIIDFISTKEISNNIIFDINFSNDNLENNYKANCSFNIESKKIICEDINKRITIDDNIIIKSMKNYLILNNNQTLYFLNFENIRTYTIKAGLIEKLSCHSEAPYTFNLIDTSSLNIPNEVSIDIPVLINNDENYIAKCVIKNSDKYNMSCNISDIKCPKNIILNNEKINPNEILFYPNTTFFNGFNNKRTITIKAGKIQKGQCASSKYNYTFIENKIDYSYNSIINFKLNTSLDGYPYISNCYINISEINAIINCQINKCQDSDDDLLVKSNPENDYTTMYPNSIFFDCFHKKNTTTIIMKNSGLIIKQQNAFIITENDVKENDTIYNSFNIIMKVKINKEDSEASCIVPPFNKEKQETFNITCYIYYSEEDEIKIIEEPIDDNYYFSGYENKSTLTLKAGSLYKDNNDNTFDIRNSIFRGEYPLISEFEFNLPCLYNIDESEESLCSFSTFGVLNSDNINIVCKTIKSDIEIKNITILNNPKHLKLNENITLYFESFEKLNLYTLNPGNKIIKGKCEYNSFTFNLIDTKISKSLSNQISVNIPLKINGKLNNSICKIVENMAIFNMSCKINDYCPENNIDIKIEKMHMTDIDIISPDSLYINISSEIQTSTLNFGYLKKENCTKENGNYNFSINNNKLSGKNVENLNAQFKLKLIQFNNEANCKLNPSSIDHIDCNVLLNPDEMDYCNNSYKDIKVEKLIDNEDNYIILENKNILHLYGIDNLETFTITGGELNQGSNNGKLYTFYLNNSFSYNNIISTKNKIFYLSLLRPKIINANCSLPLNIEKEKKFNITCEINENIKNYVIETRNENPKDIEYNTQYINFKEFLNKNTEIILTAGQMKLGNKELKDYYLNFTNSEINKKLDRDITFDIEIEINDVNDIPKNITCNLYQNNKDLQCKLEKYTSINIKHIFISKEPYDNINVIEGKTLTFKTFRNKEIDTFIAGSIEKGKCDKDGIKYLFYFRNCTSLKNKIGTEFSLQMNYPNSEGKCTIIVSRFTSKNLFDVECSIKDENSCSDVDNIEFTVGTNEPEPNIIDNLKALYYLNFTGQTTEDKRVKYNFNGGILTKKSVVNTEGKTLYTFNIEDWSLDIPLNEDYEFKIKISLDIYEDYSIKNYKGESKCIIPKGICDVNNTNIKIECSFTTPDDSYYASKENYDILIEEGDQRINLDEERVLIISRLNDLSTITIYNCQINKGQCDSNNKYTFYFTSCINPKEIQLEQDFEYNLKAKTGENSICKMNDKNSFKCEINDYSICGQNNDIIIDNNEAQIDYTKYPSYKNLYILGLKNLYTATLNGGAINFGKCQSTNFVFNFTHTKITNALSDNINFDILITEPVQTTSSCLIPKAATEFDLECIIKFDSECPIIDPLSLKIEEITEEKSLDLIKPNALYINNFINNNVIELKAGAMNVGQCNDKKYELYFKDSEIIGDIKGQITQDSLFTVNLNYPNTYKLNCIIPKEIKGNSKFDLNCYIEGFDKCPMYDYTYIQTSDNNPDLNSSLIPPNYVGFSNFNNQKITFDNYYLEIISINWLCLEETFDFNLTAKFDVNITEKVEFNISVTNNAEPIYIKYNCSFPENIKQGENSLIMCNMKDKTILQKNSLNLSFSVIYLEEKNKYIINRAQNKQFINNNVECPYIHIENDPSIEPSINSTDNTLQFSMKLQSSYKNKEIKIYDTAKKEYKDFLEIKLKPATSIKYFYKFLSVLSDNEFSTKCNVPKTTKSVEITCKGSDITDTKSDYFQTESNDNIEISGKKFGIESTKIKNPFKKEDSGSDSDSDSGSDTKTDEEDNGGMSTTGKVILIIFLVLVFVAIVLALVYYFCFYRKRNKDSTVVTSNADSIQQDNNRPQQNNSQNDNRNQSNSQENQSNDSEGSQQNSNQSNDSRRRHINQKDDAMEYE